MWSHTILFTTLGTSPRFSSLTLSGSKLWADGSSWSSFQQSLHHYIYLQYCSLPVAPGIWAISANQGWWGWHGAASSAVAEPLNIPQYKEHSEKIPFKSCNKAVMLKVVLNFIRCLFIATQHSNSAPPLRLNLTVTAEAVVRAPKTLQTQSPPHISRSP